MYLVRGVANPALRDEVVRIERLVTVSPLQLPGGMPGGILPSVVAIAAGRRPPTEVETVFQRFVPKGSLVGKNVDLYLIAPRVRIIAAP